jgi:hypothetical protein
MKSAMAAFKFPALRAAVPRALQLAALVQGGIGDCSGIGCAHKGDVTPAQPDAIQNRIGFTWDRNEGMVD